MSAEENSKRLQHQHGVEFKIDRNEVPHINEQDPLQRYVLTENGTSDHDLKLSEVEISEKAINDFLKQYSADCSVYEQLAHETEQHCIKILKQRLGSKVLTTSRPKSTANIEASIRRRLSDRLKWTPQKGYFKDAEDVRLTLPDLAGVRIILAFPDDDELVHKFITRSFEAEREPVYWGVYPDGRPRVETIEDSKNRFLGYRAAHYCVSWKTPLPYPSFKGKRVEIQVTSMAMYAWQEVNHDLIYKVSEEFGALTEDEKRTLDMVNGLVHANEVALNQFHASLNRRLEKMKTDFHDKESLFAWLKDYAISSFNLDPVLPVNIKHIDLLFITLRLLNITTPGQLEQFLKKPIRKPKKEPLIIMARKIDEIENIGRRGTMIGKKTKTAAAAFSDCDYGLWVILKLCVQLSSLEEKSDIDETNEKLSILINKTNLGLSNYDGSITEIIRLKRAMDSVPMYWGRDSRGEAARSSIVDSMLKVVGRKVFYDADDFGHYFQKCWNSFLNDVEGESRYYMGQPNLVFSALACLGMTAVLKAWSPGIEYLEPMYWTGIADVKAMKQYGFAKNLEDGSNRQLEIFIFLVLHNGKWYRIFANWPKWRYVRVETTPSLFDALSNLAAIYEEGIDWMPGHREWAGFFAVDARPNIPSLELSG